MPSNMAGDRGVVERRRRLPPILVAVAALFIFCLTAESVVLYAKQEALQLLFPEADRIVARPLFLTQEQIQRIQKRARTPFDTALVTVHVGMRQDTVLGYAFLDIHTVRTQPEAVFIALTPEGVVAQTLIVAFHEPPEYMPPARWQEQFAGKTLEADLRVRRDIVPLSGATLSAHALTDAVRTALAIYHVALKQGPS